MKRRFIDIPKSLFVHKEKKKLVPIYRALQSKCFEAAIDEYTLVNIMDEASSFDDTHLVAFGMRGMMINMIIILIMGFYLV